MPQRDLEAFLWDVREAGANIGRFVTGQTLESYRNDLMLRSAVERQFEIIGEALAQASRTFPDLQVRLPQARQIIAFRNVLAHGYAFVDDEVVWAVIETDLVELLVTVSALMGEDLMNS